MIYIEHGSLKFQTKVLPLILFLLFLDAFEFVDNVIPCVKNNTVASLAHTRKQIFWQITYDGTAILF